MKPIIEGNVSSSGYVTICDFVEIKALNNSKIILLGGNTIYPYARQMAEGQEDLITIGLNTRIQIRTNIHGCVEIGRDTIIAPDVFISSGTHFYDFNPALTINDQDKLFESIYGSISLPVIIGDDVWIGRLTTISPGITIGNGAVIGANSVVTKDIPANEVWAGNPCRFIKKRGLLPNHKRLQKYKDRLTEINASK